MIQQCRYSVLIFFEFFNMSQMRQLLFSFIIINQRSSITLQKKIMENYQIFGNYIMNCPFNGPNQFLYSPIMFYNPSQALIPQNNPNFHLNFASHFAPTTLPVCSLEAGAKKVDLPQEKLETEDPYNMNSQNISNSKKEEESINYIKISNRNILPNNLNLLLSYIRRVNKSGRIVQKIITKLNEGKMYTAKKFYAYQAYLKQQVPFHKTKHTLKEITQYHDSNYRIFTFQQQKFYNKVCRILISTFLKEAYLPTLLTSSKIQKTSKLEHLKIRRYMVLKLKAASVEEMEAYKFIQN